MRCFLTSLLLGFTSFLAAADQPNVVVIFMDDMGYADVSCFGAQGYETPNIDRLAQEGSKFTNFHVAQPVCSASRAALLTGCYPNRIGIHGALSPKVTHGLSADEMTLAEVAKQKGYATAAVGKWHLGHLPPFLPTKHGFDEYYGLPYSNDMWPFHPEAKPGAYPKLPMFQNDKIVDEDVTPEDQERLTTDYTAHAVSFIERNKENPFFLYLAFNAPHFPIEPPDEWLAKVKKRAPQLDEKRALNVALVEHLDDRIGQVLATLKETGLDQNTVVAFSSDNGGSLPHAQNNDPWRDGKQSHYDGGLRVPFMVRWPGHVQAGSRTDYAGLNFDLFPTFLELAGAKASPELDAVSLVPVLEGKPVEKERELYFVRREGGPAYGGKSYEALIRGDWKLMQNDPYSPLELYNLKNDPQEKNNLRTKAPKIFSELSTALRLHIQRGGSVPWQAQP